MKSITPKITLKILFLLLVTLTAVFEIVGDIIFKKWAISGKTLFLIIGLFVFLLATITWAFALKYELLSKAISILTILNLVVAVLVGVIYFKDDLSIVNKLGIVLGIVSLILIEI